MSLSQGELYTFVTNKSGKGKGGTLVASIKGTLSKNIIEVLLKLGSDKRLQVKEVTLDMAKNMEAAVRTVFTNALLVTYTSPNKKRVIKLQKNSTKQHEKKEIHFK